MGDPYRFATAERFASYSGTTPRVHASGGKVRYGKLRQDVNRYLKWAFIEAANVIKSHHRQKPQQYVSRLYARLKQKKNASIATGAVARHLAEATFYVQTKKQAYREPIQKGDCQQGPNAISP